jgi:hypothetical protein
MARLYEIRICSSANTGAPCRGIRSTDIGAFAGYLIRSLLYGISSMAVGRVNQIAIDSSQAAASPSI